MAKRGRKKKNKVTQLSAADKGHLKRILGKVRQIKANKAAAAPTAVNSGDLRVAMNQLAILQKNFQTFLATTQSTAPGWQARFDALSKQIANQQAIVNRIASGG